MTASSGWVVAALLLGAGWAVWDVSKTEEATIVVYATPALRDLLESDLIPAYQERTGHRVAPVYVAAGQQYNRLRMSGDTPEADLFLHASPLYLEKGHSEGYVEPLLLENDADLGPAFRSREVEGGRVWYAFAWSPLVEVVPASVPAAPDLAESDASFGFPHPVLSNNGVYVVLFLEKADPAVGEGLLRHTRVQPTNARANVGGVADGSFDVTLGYEAVVKFYQAQDAAVRYEAPLLQGERVTVPVVFSAALLRNEDRHPGAEGFIRFLFTREAQDLLAGRHFRPVLDGAAAPAGVLDLSGVRVVEPDWSDWRALEATLPRYEVKA